MKVSVVPYAHKIRIEWDTALEKEQFGISFTKKIRNARFRTKNNPHWDGSVSYMKNNLLSIGFWYRVKYVCKKFGFTCKYDPVSLQYLIDDNIVKEEVFKFCTHLMKDHPKYSPRKYQMESVYRLLRHKYSMADLSTSAGKTLIVYMYIQYLRWKYKKSDKFLIITADADLVIQMYGDFTDYCSHLSGKFNMCMVHGGNSLKDIKEYDVSIGNFQTLQNRGDDFFEHVTAVIGDESHRGKSKSITTIIGRCSNATRRIGVSGTIKNDNTADYYSIEAAFGPKVMKVTKKDMMDSGAATRVKVDIKVLSYLPAARREQLYKAAKTDTFGAKLEGNKLYDVECKLYRASEARLDYIAKLVSEMDGNCLILFKDKKHKYGMRIMNRIKQATDWDVYYVDGDTPKKTRRTYMNAMESGINKVIVANWVTFGTGKSIKNLKYVIAAESLKSMEAVGQALGRLMRLHESMEEAYWIDLVDDFRWKYKDLDNGFYVEKTHNNILYRHMKYKIDIYKDEQLEYDAETVKLTEFSDL